jgi:hypothetical protein
MLVQLLQLAEQALAGVVAARRIVAFWGPLTDTASLLGPLAAIASVLGLALLTGLAVGSLSTLIVSVLVLYFVLTEIFGLSIELSLPV